MRKCEQVGTKDGAIQQRQEQYRCTLSKLGFT